MRAFSPSNLLSLPLTPLETSWTLFLVVLLKMLLTSLLPLLPLVLLTILCSVLTHTNHHSPSPHPRRDFVHADFDSLALNLAYNLPHHLLSLSDPDKLWLTLRDTIHQAIDLHVPVKRVLRRSSWFTSKIRHYINCIHSLK